MTVRASPFVVALLLCCGSSVASAEGPCATPKCSVRQTLATRIAIKRPLMWESPGDWVQHRPYKAEQWYYYFRPYQATNYGRIESVDEPALPFSTRVFDTVEWLMELNENSASPSDI